MPCPPSARSARPGLILAAGAWILAACGSDGPSPEGPPPSSLAGADPLVAAVQPTAAGVRVVVRAPEPDVGGDTVRAAARVARQIARAAQAGVSDLPAGARVVTLALYGVDVDRFGQRTPGRFFETDFQTEALRRVDLKATGPAAVLNLAADLRLDPAGDGPAAAWCMRYPHAAWTWCARARD